MAKFSICIATYKRVILLGKLLDSLLKQDKVSEHTIEIIVIDNDIDRTAQTIQKEFIKKDRFEFKYDIVPEKNISLARNKAISLATGDFILFIDDDEVADENWIFCLYKTFKEYNTDAVIGQVKSYFDDTTPHWIKNCYVFNRSINITGQPPSNLNSGNCLFKKELFKDRKYMFDPAYGITGGSDFHLFSIMKNAGVKFIGCEEAVSYEYVPPSRANIKWLVKRVSRTGNNYSRTLIENNNYSIKLKLQELTKGFFQGIIALFFAGLLFFSPEYRLRWFLVSISNFSKVPAVFKIYKHEYK